jgi:hypothetical protein
LAAAATASMRAAVLALGATELFGVAPGSAPTVAAIGELFDKVTSSRRSGAVFTPAALAELCSDIGFHGDEAPAAAFLSDLATARQRSSGAAAPASAAPGSAVQLDRGAFTDYMLCAAAAAEVEEARVGEYLRVFYLLHMSGIREQAGVAPAAR